MRKKLLLLLAVTFVCAPYLFSNFFHRAEIKNQAQSAQNEMTLLSLKESYLPAINPSDELKAMLLSKANKLNATLIDKIVTTYFCANKYHVEHNNILTIIDYSLPSSEKRLWVFDVKEKKLLFHSYVSHGIKSGTLLSKYFSNRYNSKASSLGIYKTEKAYYGREGLSLRLEGLENGFNDHAFNRSIVMHGGWYMDEHFIKRYGRAGRSWGCPALPLNLAEPIINTIKDNSLFVVYYPNDPWLLKSKFLNCDYPSSAKNIAPDQEETQAMEESELREEVLFADLNKKGTHEENQAIVAMPADAYENTFHIKAPLARMLRRQIDHAEYIALSTNEFKNLAVSQVNAKTEEKNNYFNSVYFVIPVLKMKHGYYETEMKIVNLGTIKEIKFNMNLSNNLEQIKKYIVYFENKPFIYLHSTNQFIRWLGL